MSEGFPKNPEKRHYKRIDAELPVRLEMNGQEIQSTTQNISCGGMFLNSPQNFVKPEDSVVAFITLPGTQRAVKLNGRVCRIETQADSTGAAIEFSGLYDENHQHIDQFVKNKLLN